MNTKRILSAALALTLAAGANYALPQASAGAWWGDETTAADSSTEIADSGKCGENLTYTLDSEGTLTISGDGEMKAEAFCGEYPPFGIDTVYSKYESIAKVVINEGVTSIGRYAFTSCSNIKEVTLPDSLETIEEGAFLNCTEIKTLKLPDNLKKIGRRAFYGCGIEDVTIPAKVEVISAEAFEGSELKTIELPKTVKSIEFEAFSYCMNLESVTILNPDCEFNDIDYTTSEGLEIAKQRIMLKEGGVIRGYKGSTAQEYAEKCGYKFVDIEAKADTVDSGKCGDKLNWTLDSEGVLAISGTGEMKTSPWKTSNKEDIKSVVIEDGAASIAENAFYELRSLRSVTIADSVEAIGDSAFDGCINLVSVKLPENLKTIGSGAFNNCGFASIDIPGKVTEIGSSAFRRCPNLASIVLPDSLTTLKDTAFIGCANLKSVKLSENLTAIEKNTFWECSSLTSITIPESVKSIGQTAFLESGLESVTIPASVTKIGAEVFKGCSDLKEITILNEKCEIDGYLYLCPETASIRGYEKSTAQKYADEKKRVFDSLGEAPRAFGDPTGDGKIDSSDATFCLVEYSNLSTGGTSELTNAEKTAADVNKDEKVDSKDASAILSYYSYCSTGGKDSIEDFLFPKA